MASSSERDTVETTNTNKSTTNGINPSVLVEGARKRRRLEPSTTNIEIPKKTQRRDGTCNFDVNTRRKGKAERAEDRKVLSLCKRKQDQISPTDSQDARTAQVAQVAVTGAGMVRDNTARLRKTIQWLEEGIGKLRENLANVRTELHEERRAAKIAKRDFDFALREARFAEAAKYQPIIDELKTRLAHSASPSSPPSSSPSPSPSPSPSLPFKLDPVKNENHRRELSTLRKRLAEAENTIRRLECQSVKSRANKTRNADGTSLGGEARRLQAEVRSLRAENEKLEEKLRVAVDVEKARISEIRVQRQTYEAEFSALRESHRSETTKMMDELRGKGREIEELSKLLNDRKLPPVEHDTMWKLRENERNQPIRSSSRIKRKILADDVHTVGSCVREVESGRAMNEIEVERLRELALEQQEIIEILRQAVKERERKLEQLSNKRKKEEYYKQWLELEPVVEVDDEEDHEENDSALSSAPSSMSPQPGGCGQWQGNGVTREAYEAVLVEIEDLQSKLLKEQWELSRAKIQVCDLEKALLQEKCADRDKELSELRDKLRTVEEREAALLVELSEIREQNELLEFRLLELEESPARRDSPDHAIDSGVVSPEPAHANKDHLNKQRSRAVATVIPYTNNATVMSPAKSASPVLPRKPPLTLQESGIFEEYEDEEEAEVEFASRGTQTQAPSGELLQEVQRLQELRAWIQERAAKNTTPVFHPIDSSKICLDMSTMDSIVQMTAYQERVRDLEERLQAHEEAEKSREQEKRLSKQREEEFLDENYRLTERIYWLENELRNVRSSLDEISVGGGRGEVIVMKQSKLMEDSKDEALEDTRNSEKAASCTHAAQTVEMCADNAIAECSRCQHRVADAEDANGRVSSSMECNVTLVSLEEKKKEDEVGPGESVEPVVTDFAESDSEKKVIYFRWR
ncbi:janus kinase and microtubule-interacting protein 3 isoform X2 [Harpegnathos saltator]|uniref:janus kinase and microtubule-interacting protein 3 isoform X2 n=1 Tax=Harpegnathos saltator TaxID=610380 RepID=UPI000DBED286|nr:janus kinase and microtubule-interacting protein 3 isoform X2 [Harpegnathos saltator]